MQYKHCLPVDLKLHPAAQICISIIIIIIIIIIDVVVVVS